jgi:hypothetical protein
MPPIDQPATSGRFSLSRVIRPATVSPIRRIVSVPFRRVVRPTPSLSSSTIRCPPAASASRKVGSQLPIVPPRPMTITSGQPLPQVR